MTTTTPRSKGGRPKGPPTRPVAVRIPVDLLKRIAHAAGDRPISEFLRDAIERELKRRENIHAAN